MMNGLLGIQPPSEFGTCAILVASPAAPAAGYGVPFLVRNKKQVATAFSAVENADVVKAINDGYYGETAEGNKLYILAMAQVTNMATLLSAVNADKVLNMANGSVRMVGVIKFPSVSYTFSAAEGFDPDVHAAVIAGQLLADAWFNKKKPFRYLLQGFGFVSSVSAKDYSSQEYRNGGIVVGSVNDNTALATLQALGRASRSQPQQNIGRIKSGPLTIADDAVVKIGDTIVEQMDSSDLDELWDKRYICFEKNQTGTGYVFNDDNMLTAPDDDYNNLRFGRVIDNATRIAYEVYYQELKDDVDVDANGRLSKVAEVALQTAIETGIDAQMRPQLSKKTNGAADVVCLVNPDPQVYASLYTANDITDPNFNIIQTETVYLFVLLKPKGCLKYLNVYLGLTSTNL